MTMSYPICVVLDILGPILYKSYIIRSLKLKRANLSFGLATVLGFLIGCTWEIPFGLLGNQFLITPNNPLGFSIHIIHAVWDSIIFMIGLYALHIRKNARYSTNTVYNRRNLFFGRSRWSLHHFLSFHLGPKARGARPF